MTSLRALNPIQYAFDPLAVAATSHPKHSFAFLGEALTAEVPGLEDSNCFDPHSLGLPWPTTFPACVQSKYWRDARDAAHESLADIRSMTKIRPGSQPHWNSKSTENLEEQYSALVDTVSSCAVNMFPADNAQQAKILEDESNDVDCEAYEKGLNVLKEALAELPSFPCSKERYKGPWKNPFFQKYVTETIHENLPADLQLIEGLLLWVQHTLRHRPKAQQHFSSFKEYVEYRIKDFTIVDASAFLQITRGIVLSEQEREPFDPMFRQFIGHFSLTHDLYSYDKEVPEAEEQGTALVNVSAKTAKSIFRHIILDLESQVHDSYTDFGELGTLIDRQLRYARSMIESLAGILFHTCTLARYARALPSCDSRYETKFGEMV